MTNGESDGHRIPPWATSKEVSEILHPSVRARARTILNDPSIGYLGPVAKKDAWRHAVEAARIEVIASARRGTIATRPELQIVAHRATGRKVSPHLFEVFTAALNDHSRDGCLLSSIVVDPEQDQPGVDTRPLARRLGGGESTASMQAAVYRHLRSQAAVAAEAVGEWWAPLVPEDALEWELLLGLIVVRCHHCTTVFSLATGPIVAVVVCYPDRLDWFGRVGGDEGGTFHPVTSGDKIVSCPAGHAVGYSLPDVLERNVRRALSNRLDSIDA